MFNKFLFCGPRGCGKNYFREFIFNAIQPGNKEFIYEIIPKAIALEDPILRIPEKFETMENSNVSAVVIENIDTFIKDLRKTKKATQLLLDSIKSLDKKICLIATTTNPSNISRNARFCFDDIIPFCYLDQKGRYDFLASFSFETIGVVLEDDSDLEEISKMTKWFSREELSSVIMMSCDQKKMARVSTKDLKRSYDFIRKWIDIDLRVHQIEDLLNFIFQFCSKKPVQKEFLEAVNGLIIDIRKSGVAFPLFELNRTFEIWPYVKESSYNIVGIVEKYGTHHSPTTNAE